jgi:type IX secretion system substrate protein
MKKLLLSLSILFSITCAVAQEDIGISNVFTPADSSILENNGSYPISVRIKNYGTTVVDTITMFFTVLGNTQVDDTLYTTLNVGDSVDHTFSSPFIVTSIASGSGACGTNNSNDMTVNNNGILLNYNMVPSGIKENEAAQKVILTGLYPNPSSQTLNFILIGKEDVTVNIYAIDGKLIYNKFYALSGGKNQFWIPVGNFPKGNYIFAAQFESGAIERKFQITR